MGEEERHERGDLGLAGGAAVRGRPKGADGALTSSYSAFGRLERSRARLVKLILRMRKLLKLTWI